MKKLGILVLMLVVFSSFVYADTLINTVTPNNPIQHCYANTFGYDYLCNPITTKSGCISWGVCSWMDSFAKDLTFTATPSGGSGTIAFYNGTYINNVTVGNIGYIVNVDNYSGDVNAWLNDSISYISLLSGIDWRNLVGYYIDIEKDINISNFEVKQIFMSSVVGSPEYGSLGFCKFSDWNNFAQCGFTYSKIYSNGFLDCWNYSSSSWINLWNFTETNCTGGAGATVNHYGNPKYVNISSSCYSSSNSVKIRVRTTPVVNAGTNLNCNIGGAVSYVTPPRGYGKFLNLSTATPLCSVSASDGSPASCSYAQSTVTGANYSWFAVGSNGIRSTFSSVSNVSTFNSAPTINGARIYPTLARPSDTLQGWCDATDPDSLDSIAYNYYWYKNGVLQSSGTTGYYSAPHVERMVSTTGGTILGDNWTFNCSATDSLLTSPLAGANVTISYLYTELSNCVNITLTGNYTFLNNLTAFSYQSTCLNVFANNSVIDCGGKSIIGGAIFDNASNYISAIHIFGNNDVVKNCDISGWNSGVVLDGSYNNLTNNTLRNMFGTFAVGGSEDKYSVYEQPAGGRAYGIIVNGANSGIYSNVLKNFVGGSGVNDTASGFGGAGGKVFALVLNSSNNVVVGNLFLNISGGTAGSRPIQVGSSNWRGGIGGDVYLVQVLGNVNNVQNNSFKNIVGGLGGFDNAIFESVTGAGGNVYGITLSNSNNGFYFGNQFNDSIGGQQLSFTGFPLALQNWNREGSIYFFKLSGSMNNNFVKNIATNVSGGASTSIYQGTPNMYGTVIGFSIDDLSSLNNLFTPLSGSIVDTANANSLNGKYAIILKDKQNVRVDSFSNTLATTGLFGTDDALIVFFNVSYSNVTNIVGSGIGESGIRGSYGYVGGSGYYAGSSMSGVYISNSSFVRVDGVSIVNSLYGKSYYNYGGTNIWTSFSGNMIGVNVLNSLNVTVNNLVTSNISGYNTYEVSLANSFNNTVSNSFINQSLMYAEVNVFGVRTSDVSTSYLSGFTCSNSSSCLSPIQVVNFTGSSITTTITNSSNVFSITPFQSTSNWLSGFSFINYTFSSNISAGVWQNETHNVIAPTVNVVKVLPSLGTNVGWYWSAVDNFGISGRSDNFSLTTTTVFIDVVYLTQSPDLFTNYSLKANISGADNTTSANLTLRYPNGSNVTYLMSGIGSVFESTPITAYPNGSYIATVVTSTGVSRSLSFNVSDIELISPSSYTAITSAGLPYNFTLQVLTNTPANVSYSATCVVPYGMNCSLPPTFYVSNYLNLSVGISTNGSVLDGTYSGYINLTRQDGKRFNIPMTLGVATEYGIPQIQNMSGFASVMVSNEIRTVDYVVKNVGSYNLSNCVPSIDGSFTGLTFFTGSPNFALGINESKTFTLSYVQPSTGIYQGYLNILCSATFTGITNGLSPINKPYQQLFVTAYVPPNNGNGGGGGGGGSPTQTVFSNASTSQVFQLLNKDGSANGYISYSYPSEVFTKTFIAQSKVSTDLNLKISCNGDFCQYVKFSKDSFGLSGFGADYFTATISVPSSVDANGVYSYEVVLSDNSGKSVSLVNQVHISSLSKWYSKFSPVVQKGQSGFWFDLGGFNVPKLLLYLMLVLIVDAVTLMVLPKSKFYSQNLVLILTFVSLVVFGATALIY